MILAETVQHLHSFMRHDFRLLAGLDVLLALFVILTLVAILASRGRP